jgi:hypothetical protein
MARGLLLAFCFGERGEGSMYQAMRCPRLASVEGRGRRPKRQLLPARHHPSSASRVQRLPSQPSGQLAEGARAGGRSKPTSGPSWGKQAARVCVNLSQASGVHHPRRSRGSGPGFGPRRDVRQAHASLPRMRLFFKGANKAIRSRLSCRRQRSRGCHAMRRGFSLS